MRFIILIITLVAFEATSQTPELVIHNDNTYIVEKNEWELALALSRGQAHVANKNFHSLNKKQQQLIIHETAIEWIRDQKAKLITLHEYSVIPKVYTLSEIVELSADREQFSPNGTTFGPKTLATPHTLSYYISIKENILIKNLVNTISIQQAKKYYDLNANTLFPSKFDFKIAYEICDRDNKDTVNHDVNKKVVELSMETRKSDEIAWGEVIDAVRNMSPGKKILIDSAYHGKINVELISKTKRSRPSFDDSSDFIKRRLAMQKVNKRYLNVSNELKI